MAVYTHPVSIQTSDLDERQKFVRYEIPFTWFLRTDEAMFRERDFDFAQLAGEGYFFSLVKVGNTEYVQPLRKEHHPVVVSRVKDVGNSSIIYEKAVLIMSAEDAVYAQAVASDARARTGSLERILAVRSSQLTTVFMHEGKPHQIPEAMRAMLRSYRG